MGIISTGLPLSRATRSATPGSIGSRPTLPWLTITKSAVRASSWGLFLAHNSILAILSAYKYGHRTVRHNTMGLTAEHEPHQPPMAMR